MAMMKKNCGQNAGLSGTKLRLLVLDVISECEGTRIDAVKAQAAVPEGCSSEIVAAPARGGLVRHRPTETVMTPSGPRVRYATIDGRHPAAVGDAFDRAQAAARNDRLFEPDQVAVGRHYAAITERYAAAGAARGSLASLLAPSRSGEPGCYIDAVMMDGRALEAMHVAIGEGAALVPLRRSADGSSRRSAISDRDLVDLFCLSGLSVDAILRRHGWSCNGEARGRVVDALRAALDRMVDRHKI